MHLKPIAKRQKNLFCRTNQAKIHSFTSAAKFEVPKYYAHGVRLDNKNKNTKWHDTMEIEMKQLDDYQEFNDLGLHAEVPEGFKKIRVHLIFDVSMMGGIRQVW